MFVNLGSAVKHKHRTITRRIAVATVLVAGECVFFGVGSASAAPPGIVSIAGPLVKYAAGAGFANNLTISYANHNTRIRFNDVVTITTPPGGSCVHPFAGNQTVVDCQAAGITWIRTSMNDRNDTVTNTTLLDSSLWGGDGSDTLNGGHGVDHLGGESGNDTLHGGGSADQLDGGSGNDTVSYDDATESVYADLQGDAGDGIEGENDRIYGNVENLRGGSAADFLTGNSGKNTIVGNGGSDYLAGGAGADNVLGGDDPDSITAGDGNDYVNGGDGADLIYGQGGDDTLAGGPDNDWLDGGLYTGIEDNDTYFGGTGTDTVSYGSQTQPVVADTDGETGDDGAVFAGDVVVDEADTIQPDVENLQGGNSHDWLSGSSTNLAANRLSGGPGNDVLRGYGGNDALLGGPGNDTMYGGAGTDLVSYADHKPNSPVHASLDGLVNDGGPGESDTIGTDVEDLDGGHGNDTLIGDDGPNVLDASTGNDVINGKGGLDSCLNGETLLNCP